MEKALIPYVINNLFDEVEVSFRQYDKSVTDDILVTLYGLFGKVLDSALELVDSNSVTVLLLKNSSPSSEQFLLQVSSSSGSSYILFPRVNYCQCVFYRKKVLGSKLYPACKHFIAANLAYIWSKYHRFEIEFDAYKAYIEDIPRS